MIFVIFYISDLIDGGLTGSVYVGGKNMNKNDDKPKTIQIGTSKNS